MLEVTVLVSGHHRKRNVPGAAFKRAQGRVRVSSVGVTGLSLVLEGIVVRATTASRGRRVWYSGGRVSRRVRLVFGP